MIKKLIIVIVFICISCQKRIADEALPTLAGYWEIEHVEFANGGKKQYSVNPSVDYIQVAGMKGFRKKVHPKFDGSFDTSDDAELFDIIKKDEHFVMVYKNAWSTWEEKLMVLESNSFSVQNEEGLRYTYKRYKPLNIAQ